MGKILREIAFRDFNAFRPFDKVNHSFSLFFYNCYFYNYVEAAELMWNDPDFAQSQFKMGPFIAAKKIRKNRLVYYMLLYKNEMFSQVFDVTACANM